MTDQFQMPGHLVFSHALIQVTQGEFILVFRDKWHLITVREIVDIYILGE